MAVVVPAEFPIVTAAQLLGRVEAGREPLETLGEASNWLYAQHRPPIVAVSPYSRGSSSAETINVGCHPSADGLTYEITLGYYTTAGTWNLEISESADGSSYSTVLDVDTTDTIGNKWLAPFGTTFTLSASTRVLEIRLAHDVASDDIQPHYLMIRPTVTSMPVAASAPSGFVKFDDALLAGTGGPVYVELLNRIASNVRAVMRDRRQVVATFAAANLAIRPAAGGHITTKQAFRIPYHIAGQQSCDVSVRVNGYGITAACQLHVSQVLGSDYQSFDLSSATHDVKTLSLQREEGEIVGTIDIGAGAAGAQIRYCVVDWRPGD